MDISGKRSAIMIAIAVLWVVITVLGWTNRYLLGMFLGVILMLLHVVMGAANKGKVSLGFLVYPVGVWAVLWIVGFALSWHFAGVTAGTMPDFTILGFHPSFAWTILTYWLGGVATLTLGFVALKDQWLSQEDWDNFKKEIDKINKEEMA